MTFQDKYWDKLKEAQKLVQENLSKINMDDCVQVAFDAISDEFDKKVTKEFDANRIKDEKVVSISTQFEVLVDIKEDSIVMEAGKIVPNPKLAYRLNTSELRKKCAENLSKELEKVGISLSNQMGERYIARLNFANNAQKVDATRLSTKDTKDMR